MAKYIFKTHKNTFFYLSSNKKEPKFLEVILRKKLNKAYSFPELKEFHEFLNISIPICNICGKAFVPYRYQIALKQDEIKIVGFEQTKNLQYCYASSDICEEMSKGRKMNPNSARFISLVMKIMKKGKDFYNIVNPIF
jgi:hypothetical protein